MTAPVQLWFVYNADTGLFNTLADIGHKLFSPQTYECALCALTHGLLSERRAWRSFVEQLACDCQFLHRDQFLARFPDDRTPLPAVLTIEQGQPRCHVSAAQIRACCDLAALERLIGDCCNRLSSDGRPQSGARKAGE